MTGSQQYHAICTYKPPSMLIFQIKFHACLIIWEDAWCLTRQAGCPCGVLVWCRFVASHYVFALLRKTIYSILPYLRFCFRFITKNCLLKLALNMSALQTARESLSNLQLQIYPFCASVSTRMNWTFPHRRSDAPSCMQLQSVDVKNPWTCKKTHA